VLWLNDTRNPTVIESYFLPSYFGTPNARVRLNAVSAKRMEITTQTYPQELVPWVERQTLIRKRTSKIRRKIIPFSSLVTPNLDEMERMGGESVITDFMVPFLVKGGHGDGDTLTDRLVGAEGERERWEGSRIMTRHSHGTGCTLSAAIATYLGGGDSMIEAIGKARQYVRESLKTAPGYGAGHGPMGVPKI